MSTVPIAPGGDVPPSDLPSEVWERLRGRLWHVTTTEGWRGICSAGAIHAREADQPCYTRGYCRLIGAVSLFDLAVPLAAVEEASRDWLSWLSGREDRVRLWLELDRVALGARLIDPATLRAQYRNTTLRPWPLIIAGVEAAHTGPVPFSAITGVTLFDGRTRHSRCSSLARVLTEAKAFAAQAPPSNWTPDMSVAEREEFAVRLRAARERVARLDKT